MKKTAQELIEVITKNDLLEALFDDDLDCIGDVEELGLGELEYKDSREDTSEFWQVIYFKDHDVYLRIEGEFDSYMEYEHSYNTVTEVKPKEIQTIIYE